MNNDGSGARKIANGTSQSKCPIATYRPDPSSVLYVAGSKFYKVRGSDGQMTEIHSSSRSWQGEIAINDAGTRMAGRDSNTDLYCITVGGGESKYSSECSSSISPNGSYVTANGGGHTDMDIYNWNRSHYKTLTKDGGEWDNQRFAVNSSNYVVYNYDGHNGLGVVDIFR